MRLDVARQNCSPKRMVHVIATIEVAPGTRDAFLAEFRKLMPQVHAEEGCIEYGPAVDVATGLPVQDAPRPDTVMVIEKWADVEALKAHLVAPHMTAYRERVKEFIRGVRLQVLQPAA
jgi:quinol monooxygenase YgiN